MSRSSILAPQLAKRENDKVDNKQWTNLLGSSASIALFNAVKTAEQPILLITHDTPSALKFEQELQV